MKKLLLGLLAVILLLVIVAVALPFLIPADTYRSQIVQAVESATGRTFTIAGDLGISILPRLGVTATDVSLSNVPGAQHPNMLELEELVVALQIWPLLRGEVKVDSFVLDQPAIHLQVDKEGRPNWVFDTAEAKAPSEQAPDAGGDGGIGDRLSQLSLGEVRLDDGVVTYHDARTGETMQFGDIDLAVSLPDLDSPFSTRGDLTWNDREVELVVESEGLRNLLDGGAAPLRATVSSEPASLAFDGEVAGGPSARVNGQVDLNVDSIRELAAWTGNPIELAGDGLRNLSVVGALAFADGKLSFTNAQLRLDEITGQGEVAVDTTGAKPSLTASLDLGELNLNPYLPPEQQQQAQPAGGAAPAAGAGGWSDQPYNFSALNSANAALKLNVAGIRLREITVGKSALTATLQDGVLTLDLQELNLYNGRGTGRMALNAAGGTPAAETALTLEGVGIGPLLQDAAAFDRLEGTGNVTLSLATQGASQRAMVSALGGDGSIKLTNGAIKGINLAAVVRDAAALLQNPQSALGQAPQGQGMGGGEQTDFAELSGTFKVTDGVARNDDLLLLNPLLRVTGEGSVNLPERSLQYRVVPKLVATLEGQGGTTDLKGVAVPVIVEGSWTDLSFRPDLSGAIENIARDPAAAKEAVEGTLERLKEGGVEGVLQGLGGQPAEQDSSQQPSGEAQPQDSEKPDPGQLLRGLLNR